MLSEQERDEVLQFVHAQLSRNFNNRIEVFPYSIRPGFEGLRSNLKARFIDPALRTIRDQKEEIVNHKLQILFRFSWKWRRRSPSKVMEKELPRPRHTETIGHCWLMDSRLRKRDSSSWSSQPYRWLALVFAKDLLEQPTRLPRGVADQ